MEGAIKTVVSVFLKSAKGKENLGEKDFQNLVKNQLKNIMTDTDSSKAIKNMRQGLDSNQDGKVSFQEYMTLIGYLANAVSQQRSTENEPNAASSNQEAKTEVTAASKAEPEVAKAAEPVKEEVQVKKEEVVEVVELVEEENVEENVEEVLEERP